MTLKTLFLAFLARRSEQSQAVCWMGLSESLPIKARVKRGSGRPEEPPYWPQEESY
jgi:hypothetical protein